MLRLLHAVVRRWDRALWPTCPHCAQSMTSVYAGKATCLRCCSRRTLVK